MRKVQMVLPHLGAPASSLDRPVQFLPITALIKPGQHTPAEILALGLELRIPNAAAQTRPVSLAGIRQDSRGSKRYFKQIFCDNISEFEANMPSHAVGSLPARVHQPMTQPLPLVRIASRGELPVASRSCRSDRRWPRTQASPSESCNPRPSRAGRWIRTGTSARLTRGSLDEHEGRRATEIISFVINLEHIGDIIDKNLSEVAAKKMKRKLQFSKGQPNSPRSISAFSKV